MPLIRKEVRILNIKKGNRKKRNEISAKPNFFATLSLNVSPKNTKNIFGNRHIKLNMQKISMFLLFKEILSDIIENSLGTA